MSKNKLASVAISAIILTSINYIPYSELLSVRAQDTEDSSFRIATTGDISCSQNHAKKTINQIEEQKPDLVLWLGDLSFVDNSLECFKELTSELHENGTDIAVIGNHDDEGEDGGDSIRSQVIDHFGLPDEGYWSRPIDVPNNNESEDILLVGMDSESLSGAQFSFVKNELQNSSASLKIVLIHKPFLTCKCEHGTEEDGENDQFGTYHPIFNDTGVDLVLQGHNHNIQYFDLVDNVRYLVSGAGGKSHYALTSTPEPAHFRNDQSYGFTLIESDFTTKQLTGKFITEEGNAIGGSQFNQSFGAMPQQPSNETFTVNVGKGEAIFVPSNQSNANVTIAVDEGIAMLPMP